MITSNRTNIIVYPRKLSN